MYASSVTCSDVSATVTASVADTRYAANSVVPITAISQPGYIVANPVPIAWVANGVSGGITVCRSVGIAVIIVTVAVCWGISVVVSRSITVAISRGCERGADEGARGKPKADTTPTAATPTAMTETTAMEAERTSLSGR